MDEIEEEIKSLSDTTSSVNKPSCSFATALVAGGIAGTSVDVVLFPIDTIKTRLQAPAGFWKSGGFRGIYNGLGAVAIGSAPGAALFFSTYETMKPITINFLRQQQGYPNNSDESATTAAASHMIAASIGEAMACLVRVPTEVVKSKMQTAEIKIGLIPTIKMVLQENHGTVTSKLTGGLYRGYGITLFREIPFAAIQFPLYEKLKIIWSHQQGCPCSPFQAAACGSASGAIAAAITTPLDVIKTRLMIGTDKDGIPYQGVRDVVKKIINQEGHGTFWNGIQPRVFWITLGGFIFFGAYEEAKNIIRPTLG